MRRICSKVNMMLAASRKASVACVGKHSCRIGVGWPCTSNPSSEVCLLDGVTAEHSMRWHHGLVGAFLPSPGFDF